MSAMQAFIPSGVYWQGQNPPIANQALQSKVQRRSGLVSHRVEHVEVGWIRSMLPPPRKLRTSRPTDGMWPCPSFQPSPVNAGFQRPAGDDAIRPGDFLPGLEPDRFMPHKTIAFCFVSYQNGPSASWTVGRAAIFPAAVNDPVLFFLRIPSAKRGHQMAENPYQSPAQSSVVTGVNSGSREDL